MAAKMPDIHIRNFPIDTRERLNRAAAARGMNMGQYIAALIDLHDAMRHLADTETSDGRWEQVRTELEALGLQTIRS